MPADKPRTSLPTSTGSVAVLTPQRAVMLVLFGLGFIAVFWRWFYKQHLFSMERLQDWGHAYVVPLLAGYMVYRAWPRIVRTPITTFWPGLLAFVTGVGAYIFFVVGFSNHMGQGFAMVLALFGMTLFALGPAMMAHLFLPIAYLIFGITISEQVMIMVTFKLQNISAWGGYYLLAILSPIFGYTVSLTGNNIEIVTSNGSSIPLGIAEACSGMRMVVAFLALAGSVALLSCTWWWQRVAVMLLAVPVAIFMNLVRIAVLGLLSLIDPKLASGDAHIFIGTILLVPALGLYMGAVWSLDRIWIPEVKPVTKVTGPVVLADRDGWAAFTRTRFVVALLTLIAASAGVTAAISGIKDKLPIYPEDGRALTAISPKAAASWVAVGADTKENAEVEETLGTKNYLTRMYMPAGQPRGVRLQLHTAYYTGSIDTVPHVPERCMVGAGWQIESDPRIITLKLDKTLWGTDPRDPDAQKLGYLRARTGDQSDAPGKYVHLPKGIDAVQMQVTPFVGPDGTKMYAGYFFIANGQVATTAIDVRRMAFDVKDKYAFYMKVQVSSADVKSADELAENAAKLLDELLPELMRCVPDWLKVERGQYPPASITVSSTTPNGTTAPTQAP